MIFLERRLFRLSAYVVFFLLVFGIAATVSFPDTQVKEIAAVQIQQAVGPKYKVRIADVDLSLFTLGATAEGITIEERVEEEEEPEEEGLPENLPMKVTLKSITVRFAPIHSILNLGLAVKGVVDLGGGDVEVYFTKTFDGQKIDLNIDDLDLQPSKTPLIVGYLGVPVFGTLDGDAEIYLNEKGLPVDGEINLKGKQLTVGPATVKTDKFPPITYLEVPSTSFGAMNIEMKIRNESKGRSFVDFENVGFSGRDMRAEMWGNIGLGRTAAASEAKLKMRMQLDESFVKKNNLTAILNVNEVRRGKNKNWFGFTISGKLRKIKFRGSPDAGGGPNKSPVEKAKKSKAAKPTDKKSVPKPKK